MSDVFYVSGLQLQWLKLRFWFHVLHRCWLQEKSLRRMVQQLRQLLSTLSAARQHNSTHRVVLHQQRYYWDLHAPGFPSPVFDRFIDGELKRLSSPTQAPLQFVLMAITDKCGLQCEHCFEWPHLNQGKELALEQLKQRLAQLIKQGATQVFFTGGEPLLRADLCELITFAANDLDIWIITSGQTLTARRAQQLAQAGLRGMIISVDHVDETEHDRFRGKQGVFAQANAAARFVREAGMLLALGLCPTRSFIASSLPSLYLEMAEQWGASFIQVLAPKSEGRYAGINVTWQEHDWLAMEKWYQQVQFGKGHDRSPILCMPDLIKRRIGCMARGNRYLYIDTYGAIQACPFCKEPLSLVRQLDVNQLIPIQALLQEEMCENTTAGCAPNSCIQKNNRLLINAS